MSGGGTRKQVMRELLKEFTKQEILEIEAKLIEAATKMGQPPPTFLSPP